MELAGTIKDILKTLLSQPNYDRIQAGKLLYQLRELCADNRGLWTVHLREIFSSYKDLRKTAKRLIDAYIATQPPDGSDAAPVINTSEPNAPNPSDVITFTNGDRVDRRTGELLTQNNTDANSPPSDALPNGKANGQVATFMGEEIVIQPPQRGIILPDPVQWYKSP